MSLLSRIEKLEKRGNDQKPRIVWMEKGETQVQAWSRLAPLAADESVMFVRWLD